MDVSSELLTQRLELADALLAGRNRMFEPQDLPGRYGRVVRAIDRVLTACDCEAVVEADVVELIRHNPDQLEELRQHMRSVHADYASRLEELVQQANDAGRH